MGKKEFPFPEDVGVFADQLLPHLAALRRLALRLTASRLDADELLQNVLERLYIHRYRLARIKDLRPWLYRVMYYQFMAQSRQAADARPADALALEEGEFAAVGIGRTWACAEGSAGEAAAGPEFCAFSLQLKDYLGVVLGKLGPQPSAAAPPADLDGLSLPEIAERYAVSVSMLKSALTEARAALRAQLCAFELISARLPGRRSACSRRRAPRASAYRRMRRRRHGGGDLQNRSPR